MIYRLTINKSYTERFKSRDYVKTEQPYLEYSDHFIRHLKFNIHKWFVESNIQYSFDYPPADFNCVSLIFKNKGEASLFKLAWAGIEYEKIF